MLRGDGCKVYFSLHLWLWPMVGRFQPASLKTIRWGLRLTVDIQKWWWLSFETFGYYYIIFLFMQRTFYFVDKRDVSWDTAEMEILLYEWNNGTSLTLKLQNYSKIHTKKIINHGHCGLLCIISFSKFNNNTWPVFLSVR